MEILKAMNIKAGEFSKGLVLRGLCRHTVVPWVFEVVHNQKDDKYYLCVMHPENVGASLVGDITENFNICEHDISDTTVRGVFNQIIRIINYYNKEDGLDKQLQYI